VAAEAVAAVHAAVHAAAAEEGAENLQLRIN
jgi:hypothetical protein